MLRIKCPWCGTRDQVEFRNGGEAAVVRPPEPQSVSDDEWADYLFYRNNKKGVHEERWLHNFGCRQWFIATRDTVTHEFIDTRPMPSPGKAGEE